VKRANEDILIYAVGDIGPDRADPGSIFQNVAGVLSQGDVTFCHLEVALSNRGTGPLAQEAVKKPEVAAAMKEAGFDIVSFAGNHCMAGGIDAFYDTIENLKNQKLLVIGVGNNIEEAHQPAIVECKGTRIAFLDYNSIVEAGSRAEANRPGCATLRAWTFYEPIEPSQPGTPGRAQTFPYRDGRGYQESEDTG
jgi:poly-gamma-glutamate synthesis protein (capsule biosynthesis protein)